MRLRACLVGHFFIQNPAHCQWFSFTTFLASKPINLEHCVVGEFEATK